MCARDFLNATEDVDPRIPPKVRKIVMFNQLRGLKMKHNISTDPSCSVMQKQVAYQADLLAVSTGLIRDCLEKFDEVYKKFQNTNTYTVLTRTSQPAHVAVALCVFAVVWLTRAAAVGTSARAAIAVYVFALATHLGAQIWMTLISGLVLYFSLPRHTFGAVQTALFPAYYTFNALISLVALVSYAQIQSIKGMQDMAWLQIVLLSAVFLIEVVIRFRLSGPMLKLKHIKTQMESAAGGGQEVGKLVLGELAHCPHYMRTLRAFRYYHSAIAAGTVIGLGCSVYNISHLVDSICVI